MKLLLASLSFLFCTSAFAYPEFIGYGYGACLTCHVNGMGSGPLNDYGRALWSGEIASRALFPNRMSDEQIGMTSGFFGSAQLPYWIRPHIKYRALNLQFNPGSSNPNNPPTKTYHMQSDVGLTLQADQDGKYVLQVTAGTVPKPANYGTATDGPFTQMSLRDAYLRIEAFSGFWVYAGLLEKVYGIRNIDHNSYQRAYQGFRVVNNTADGMGESTGVVLHKVGEGWEIAVNGFAGHPQDDADYKQTGASFMGEWESQERRRWGFSGMSAKSNKLDKKLMGLHYRQGLSKGSAFLFEYGFIQDSEPNKDVRLGSYNLLQGSLLLTRGYSIKTTIERYNKEFKASEPDHWRWGFGLFMFPFPRIEWRLEAVNGRDFSNISSGPDSWVVQGQFHVSL